MKYFPSIISQKLMNSDNRMKIFSLIVCVIICSGAELFVPPLLPANDDFSFELDEYEKQPFEIGGYLETKWEHIDINQQGLLSGLNLYEDPVSTRDNLTGQVQINGSYIYGISSYHWLLFASAGREEDEWQDNADIYEGYISLKPTPYFNSSIGKKSHKWGKGYAWNPVGFINRPKDVNNPEEALEGYITGEIELIKSSSGTLQNMALTTLLLPVADGANDDFGVEDNINLAAQLYLLYLNTDVDFIAYTGNSRSSRFGVDFSRNITTNFEIHGELAYIPHYRKSVLEVDGTKTVQTQSVTSWLLGLRYLNEWNLTSIIEYYHNGTGYSEEELDLFYQLVEDGILQYEQEGTDTLLQKAQQLSNQGYTRSSLGRDYLYARFSLKEPWDILYFTPALTTIINLNDQSFSLTPEVIYTGFTNWELRVRFSMLSGDDMTEYGEKLNSNKLEIRLRYFF